MSVETAATDRAELVALQVALARGWVRQEDLREAVSLRARLRREGQERGLLALVGESRLEAAQVSELRAIYAQALGVARGDGPVGRTRAGGSDLGRVDDEATRGAPAARPPEEPPPEKVGRYELRGELGRGGMGTVHRAWDPDLGREVALKLLGAEARDEEDRERFRREARAAAALRHPHAVRVLDVGHTHDPPYLVMELVEGESLKARLQREGPWEPRAAAALVRKLAGALGAAHALGLVHRDVKPANVLLDGRGEPALTDFGLARRLDGSEERLTRSGDVLGTPTYMSPEQARGDRGLDQRSDVWSLGAVLFHLLTGRPPFLEASVMEQVRALLQREADPPSQLRPDVPPGLDAIVRRCLRRDPAARYADARALEADLAGWLEPDAAPAHAGARAPLVAALIVSAGALTALVLQLGGAARSGSGPVVSPPLDAVGLRAEGERRRAAGDLAGAIAALGSALQLAPRDPAALTLRGEWRLAAGDPHGAEADASTALELDPLVLPARLLRGRLWLARGEATRAVDELEKARDLARGGARAGEVERELVAALVTEARAALEAGDHTALERRVGRALELRPGWPPALRLRAEARLRDRDLEGALAAVEEALAVPAGLREAALDPGWLLWVRAQARWEQRQVEPALADFDAALRTLPPSPETAVVHLLRGQARLLGRGDAEGALADAVRADELLPPGSRHREAATWLRAQALQRREAR